MCGSNRRIHFYHGCGVSLTSGRLAVLGAKGAMRSSAGSEKLRIKIVGLFVCRFVSLLDSQVAFDTISCIAKNKYMNRSILNSVSNKVFLVFNDP